MRRRKGRNLKAGEMRRWTRQAFHKLGLHKLLGTIRYPGKAKLLAVARKRGNLNRADPWA